MGFYVNPENMTKEQWLKENATAINILKWNDIPKDECLLCLVFNSCFTALGVVYDERELNNFNDPADNRIKIWFLANKETVLKSVFGMKLEDFK